jgi:hypothetical protein
MMDALDPSSDVMVRDEGGVLPLLKVFTLVNTDVELDDQGE